MKITTKRVIPFLAAIGMSISAHAAAPATYTVTITNGSGMPISPLVAYAVEGQQSMSTVGSQATPGFVEICKTGGTNSRMQELENNKVVTHATSTPTPIMPGEVRTIEVNVQDPAKQSIHFETMYGKTKDICAVGSLGSHGLFALAQHVTSEVIFRDSVVQTGAFTDPAIPNGKSYLDSEVCAAATKATDCLRALSEPVTGEKKIKFFSGYLSSVDMLIENKFGAVEAQSLLLPTAGSVEFRVQLKH